VISRVRVRDLPSVAGNRLYVDYVTGSGSAATFFTHAPLDFGAAFKDRREYDYPRAYVSRRLAEYNQKLGAHPAAKANIDALEASSAFCVITGQQAGFLGGPAYTAYKIITAIRLAKKLQEELDAIFVPMLWLATEDHDFGEINHAFWLKDDGEVGPARVSVWKTVCARGTVLPQGGRELQHVERAHLVTALLQAWFGDRRTTDTSGRRR